jgi:hypothetical protein
MNKRSISVLTKDDFVAVCSHITNIEALNESTESHEVFIPIIEGHGIGIKVCYECKSRCDQFSGEFEEEAGNVYYEIMKGSHLLRRANPIKASD